MKHYFVQLKLGKHIKEIDVNAVSPGHAIAKAIRAHPGYKATACWVEGRLAGRGGFSISYDVPLNQDLPTKPVPCNDMQEDFPFHAETIGTKKL